MASSSRNPLYFLLLLAGLAFVLTALAYAIVPVLEQKSLEAGNPPPPSQWRDTLRADGWKWILYEVAILSLLALVSMIVDWRRTLQNDSPNPTIPDQDPTSH